MGLANNNTPRLEKHRLPYYIQELRSLLQDNNLARAREASQRDKMLITITAGGLVVLSTFLVNFQNSMPVGIKAFLLVMALFVISLIFQLVSYFTVDRHFTKRERDFRDWAERGFFGKPPEVNYWTHISDALTLASLLLTILGVLLLSYFGYLNIARFIPT